MDAHNSETFSEKQNNTRAKNGCSDDASYRRKTIISCDTRLGTSPLMFKHFMIMNWVIRIRNPLLQTIESNQIPIRKQIGV